MNQLQPKIRDYDAEKIIDDWVFMGFLVGNDFIPHLPDLHINHNALPMLYQTYIDVRPEMNGKLEKGVLISILSSRGKNKYTFSLKCCNIWKIHF